MGEGVLRKVLWGSVMGCYGEVLWERDVGWCYGEGTLEEAL